MCDLVAIRYPSAAAAAIDTQAMNQRLTWRLHDPNGIVRGIDLGPVRSGERARGGESVRACMSILRQTPRGYKMEYERAVPFGPWGASKLSSLTSFCYSFSDRDQSESELWESPLRHDPCTEGMRAAPGGYIPQTPPCEQVRRGGVGEP